MGDALDERTAAYPASEAVRPWRAWMQALSRDLQRAFATRRRFGAYFFLSAMVIVLAFLVYTQIFVVQAMRQETRQMMRRYAFFISIAARDTILVQQESPDLEIIFETIRNTNFPMVVADEHGKPQMWKNIRMPPQDPGDLTPEEIKGLLGIVRHLDTLNPPLPFEIPPLGNMVLHYGESPLVRRLAWLPFAALLITCLFVGVGYAGFRHIKNSEQRSIWVGMARETAHQLGTPLSSLYGWVEVMKSELQDCPDGDREEVARRFEQIVSEIEKDTSRLNKITSRFSQIGSSPELRVGNLSEVVSEIAMYLQPRLPRDLQILQTGGEAPPLPMNRELLSWAFENLFKNAADAIGGKGGRIEVVMEVRRDDGLVDILVRDNGKGIPPNRVRQVFLPGYSTKKRGWGLGLAFVKRIVEEYHRGRITVRESVPGKGTTFLISLPLAHSQAQGKSG